MTPAWWHRLPSISRVAGVGTHKLFDVSVTRKGTRVYLCMCMSQSWAVESHRLSKRPHVTKSGALGDADALGQPSPFSWKTLCGCGRLGASVYALICLLAQEGAQVAQ